MEREPSVKPQAANQKIAPTGKSLHGFHPGDLGSAEPTLRLDRPSDRRGAGLESAGYVVDTCEPLKEAAARKTLRLAAISRGSYPGRHDVPEGMPELLSVGLWDAAQRQDWKSDWHRNEGVKLAFLSRGRMTFGIDGKVTAIQRGDLCITRPWQVHMFGDPCVPPSRLQWLILDVGVVRPNQSWRWPDWFMFLPSELGRLTDLLQLNEQPVWRATLPLQRCFQNLADLTEDLATEMLETRLKLALNELFLELLCLLEEQTVELDRYLTSTRRTVEIALRDIAAGASEQWTLDSMAEHAGLARTRFSYYCRLITGYRPTEFLNNHRVAIAQRLLCANPDMSVTEIALESGFGSHQYFSTVFRNLTGLTPREYRLSQ